MKNMFEEMANETLRSMDDESLEILCDSSKTLQEALELAKTDSLFKEMLVVAGAMAMTQDSCKNARAERERRELAKKHEEEKKAKLKTDSKEDPFAELHKIFEAMFN